MRGEKFRRRKFTSKRDSFIKESSSKCDKQRWNEKRDLVCFKCKKPYKSEAKKIKKKAIIAIWSESEDEYSEEENEKEMANMCFMAINELDEVNFNISYDDIHDVFEELYKDSEKLGLKNVFLEKKVQ